MESIRNKKYKYMEKTFDLTHVNDENDKNRELLDPNYAPEINVNCVGNKFLYEERHQQMNYTNIKEYHKNGNGKGNEDYLERKKLIDDHNINLQKKKGTTYTYGDEEENISINGDNTKECSEIHYEFGHKFSKEKTEEHNNLGDFTESKELITVGRSRINSNLIIGGKIVIIIFVLMCVVFIFTKFKMFLEFLQLVIAWVGRQGAWSILLFILLFSVTAPLFMSVEIMCIGSGLIFSGVYGKILGLFVAVFCVSVGYVIGMSICFFISRYLMHDFIYRRLVGYPIYMAFNQAIESNGLSFMLLIRLSPILPASMVSYILGVTTLEYKHFAMGSVSALPSIFLFVYIGTLLQDFSNLSALENQWGNIIILIIGLIVGIIAIVYITIVTKRRLDNLNIMHNSLDSTNADLE